jgi:penicillin-binding protein 2
VFLSKKRLLTVTLAVAGALAFISATLDAATTTKGASKSSHQSVSRVIARPAVRKASSAPSSKTSLRTSRRRPSRWRVPSHADPTEGDNPAGEDPNVREAAVEGLGNWNGSAVVVDPSTGRILSIVNQKVALTTAAPPCSTFKPIVGLAALKEGLITPETRIRVARRQTLDLTEALAHSNNRFFAKLGQSLGFARLKEIGRRFGFGEKAGSDIPGENPGKFPQTYPREAGVGLMSSHGRAIGATPLQMAAAMAAIANGGTLYELQYPRTPEEIENLQPRVRERLDDLAEFFPPVKEGLAATVLYGTGRHAYDPDAESQALGKTGSCSDNGARLGWFVSYSNEPNPKYVVVVLLRGGRVVYGPTAAEIAGRIYHGLRLRDQPPAQAQARPPDFATLLKSKL